MIRPRAITIAALSICLLVTTAALSSCSTFDRADVAAEVNGTRLSHDELADLLGSDLGQALLQSPLDGGAVSGSTARGMLQAWIALTAIGRSTLITITPEIRSNAETALSSQYGEAWTSGPAVVRELAVINLVAGNAIQDGSLDRTEAQDLVREATVYVDARYGAWNQTTSNVDPFE